MQHNRPSPVAGSEVINLLGATCTCPYCNSESPIEGDDDIGWVSTPIKSSPMKYMCLGCCEDIHSTCADEDFDQNPYKSIVADAASVAGLAVKEFRCLCIKQQITSGEQRIEVENDKERYADRLNRLRRLLES